MVHKSTMRRLIQLGAVQLAVIVVAMAAWVCVAQAATHPVVKLSVSPATPKVGANVSCAGLVRHAVKGHRLVKLWATNGSKHVLLATASLTSGHTYRALLIDGANRIGTRTFRVSYFDGKHTWWSMAQAITIAAYFPYTYINWDGSTTVIPSAPKRVVVMDNPYFSTDEVARMGGNVVATTSYGSIVGADPGFDSNGIPKYLDPSMPNATSVGFWGSPDYDAISAANPDLIVVPAGSVGSLNMTVLDAIAPVVLVVGNNYPTNYTDVDMYLWQTQQLAPIFDAQNTYYYKLHQQFRSLAAELHKLVAGKTCSYIAPKSDHFLQMTGWEVEPSAVFKAAGLKVQSLIPGGTNLNATNGNWASESVSFEDLPDLTGHYLIITEGDFTGANLLALEHNALWKQIPAVKAGRVLVLSDVAKRGDVALWGPSETIWDMQQMVSFFKTHK